MRTIHQFYIESSSSVLFNILILAILVFGLVDCKNPKTTQNEKEPELKEEKQGEAMNSVPITIKPIEPYIFHIQFNNDTQQQFHLWFPEVVIFNYDTSRAAIEGSERKEWLEKIPNGYLVSGIIGNNDMRVSFKYKIKAVDEKEIAIELEVKNTGKLPWSDYAQLASCLAPDNLAFSDQVGDRTYINTKDNLLHSLNEIGVINDFNHYPVKPRNDLSDTEQRIRIASGFVSRLSADEKINISFYWDEAARVDVNPGGLDCIHSHPAIGPLKPGEQIVRKGTILLKNGTAQESYHELHSRL